MLDAVCYLDGRKPHELVADVMRGYLDVRASDPDVASLVRASRRQRSGLRVVEC